ncbi:MAG: SpoVA/SpoVAEb family sporulation membrane protein [Ruminococcus sp.]|jgi:stage V sporulation protein AE|nr:SpoVA/SpoVAEb family sporulation membrane protein [Ruminococcus sp.]
MQYFNAFWVGGLICLAGQLLIDRTGLTPARILTLFVVSGVVLGAFGLYQPLVGFAGEGASAPISGFGCLMAEGMKTALREEGALGILTGALKSSAGGIGAAVVLSLLAGVFGRSNEKG